MLERLKHFLASPVFVEDGEKTRNAYLLNIITISSGLAAASYSLVSPREQILFGALAVGVTVIAWIMMKGGYVRLASIILVAGLYLVVAVTSTLSGGVDAIEYTAFIVPILFSGLLLGWRSTVIVAFASILYGGFLVLADLRSLLPASSPYPLYVIWITNSLYFALAGLFLTLAIRWISQTLSRAQHELAERKQVEADLLQFQKLMDETSDAIFMIDPQTSHYIGFNRGAYQSLGYSREELTRLGVIHVALHIPSMAVWQERVDLVREKGSLIFETIYRRKDGTTFPVEVSARMLDYEGRTIMLAVTRDITERKRVEEELRQSENKYRTLTEQIPAVVYTDDYDSGDTVYISPYVKTLLGYSAEDWIANPELCETIIHPEDRERVSKQTGNAQQDERFLLDYRYVARDGRIVWVRDEAFLLKDETGQPTYWQGVMLDITERKLAEEALRESEERFRKIFHSSPVAICITTLEGGRLLDANDAYWNLTGYDPGTSIGRSYVELRLWDDHPERREEFVRTIKERHSLYNPDYVFSDTKGNQRSAIALYELVQIGEEPCIMSMFYDMSAQKQLEQDRENLIDELRARNAESETLRDSLASLVSSLDFSEIIQTILDQIRRVVPYDSASIWKIENETQFYIAGRNIPSEITSETYGFPITPENSAYAILKGDVPYIMNLNVQAELRDFQYEPHTYVQTWLAVPLKTRGQVIGLIALDGRQKNQFTPHHAELAVTFANQVAIALENSRLFSELQIELAERGHVETNLRQRESILAVVAEAGNLLLKSLDWKLEIDLILAKLGQTINATHAYICENHQTERGVKAASMIFEWTAPGFPSDLDNPKYQNVPLNEPDFELWYEDMNSGQAYIGDHSRLNDVDMNFLLDRGMKALLDVPIFVDGVWWGTIGFDDMAVFRIWSSSEIDALLLAGHILGAAIQRQRAEAFLQEELNQRKRAEQSLRQRESMLEALADSANRFLKAPDWRNEINSVLERLGRTINASHAYLFEKHLSDTGIMLNSLRYEWVGLRHKPDIDNPAYQNAPIRETGFERYYATLDLGEPFIGSSSYFLESEKELLNASGIKALLEMRIVVDDYQWGTIGFDEMSMEREWTGLEVDVIRVAANVLGAAIKRQLDEASLKHELNQRRLLIDELESKNTELERFTYTVSHDLKSPLFTIRGFLGYLTQDALSGDMDRLSADIQRIVDATDKMQQLLNDLLELSRIGRLMNESQAIRFGPMIHEVLELLYGQIHERGVNVEVQDGLPDVFGDRQRLFEVVQNLVENAVKFMGEQPDPRIVIGSQGEEDQKPIFFVQDNGIGILPEHFERIFGLFNKLDPRSTGTGIGLALVRRIIEFHGGRIWVQSNPGTGSVFYFTLPRAREGPP